MLAKAKQVPEGNKFNLVVLGDTKVGKTQLINTYVNNQFSDSYRATLGLDFANDNYRPKAFPDKEMLIRIWDTSGDQRFDSLTSSFLR